MTETSPHRPSRAGPWSGVQRRSGSRSATTWRVIPEPGMPLPAAPVEPVAEPEAEPEAALGFDEADLARACAAVAADIHTAEGEAALAREERRIADALEHIANAMDGADAVLAERRRQFREATACLAAAAAEALAMGPGVKVAARLADALAADCLGRFDPDLALTVEVAPDLADALGSRLAASPVAKSRPGRIAVEPMAAMAPGEARLVWQDGAADWSLQRLHTDAAALIRRLTEPAQPTRSNESEQA